MYRLSKYESHYTVSISVLVLGLGYSLYVRIQVRKHKVVVRASFASPPAVAVHFNMGRAASGCSRTSFTSFPHPNPAAPKF